MLSLLIVVIILALAFDFINGFHDTANAIATSVATRVLTPAQAIAMAAVLNFVGAMFSTKVAKTIGTDIATDPKLVGTDVIIAALVGAIIWNLFTWYYGLPSSSSHALVGGIVGSVIVGSGVNVLNFTGLLKKIVIPLFVSPVLGFTVAYGVMLLLMWIVRRWSPKKVGNSFGRLQIISAAFMAFSHGSNDAQKSMGIITMALFAAGQIDSFHVPWQVIIACALSMALGTSLGGWRIIKTMGSRIIKLEPIHGFAAETSAATVIEAASFFGMPVSTTHVISSTIMGVGATKRLSAVRWSVAKNIINAWLLTFPASAILAALAFFLVRWIIAVSS